MAFTIRTDNAELTKKLRKVYCSTGLRRRIEAKYD